MTKKRANHNGSRKECKSWIYIVFFRKKVSGGYVNWSARVDGLTNDPALIN